MTTTQTQWSDRIKKFVSIVRSGCDRPGWAVMVGSEIGYICTNRKDAEQQADEFRGELFRFIVTEGEDWIG